MIFTRRGVNINAYPSIKAYLEQFKTELTPKPKGWKGPWKGRKPGPYQWYEIQDTVAYYQEFKRPKIIYAEIATRGHFTIDDTGFFPDTTGYIMGLHSLYELAIFNSKVWTFLFSCISSEIRGGFFRWKRQYMSQLPIRVIDPAIASDIALHDKLVALVQGMLDLHKRAATACTSHEQTLTQRQIATADQEIDRLVYEFYGLTDEEIAIINP